MDVLPRKRYDPNELVGCPYDIVHRVRISRLPYHLLKCAKQHPQEGVFEVCPYNARHVVPNEELIAHFSVCPDKPLMEDFRPVRRGKTALPDNADWTVPKPDEAWDDEFRCGDDLEPYDEDLEQRGCQAQSRQSPVKLSRWLPQSMTVHSSQRQDGVMAYTKPAHASSRPPMSNPHVPRSLQNACARSSVGTYSEAGVGPLSLAALRPTGLRQLSSGERNDQALGRTMLDLAAKEGAQERPLDIAAWCSQQATISQSHACGSEGGSPEVTPQRSSIAASNEESGGYLRMHRGRGALLRQHGPLRKPGTGLAAGRLSGTASAAHDTAGSCPEPGHVNGDRPRPPLSGSHVRGSNGFSSAHVDSSEWQRSEDNWRSADQSSVEVYTHYYTRSTTPPFAPTRPDGEFEAEGNAQRRCSSNHNVSTDRSAVSQPDRTPPVSAAAGGGQRMSARLANSGGLQSHCRVDGSPPNGHATGSRLAPRHLSNHSNNMTRIRNIEKLLAVIHGISLKQSEGVQLDSNQTAMLARRSALEAERDSLLN